MQTTGLRGDERVQHLDVVEVAWQRNSLRRSSNDSSSNVGADGQWCMTPLPGTECALNADLVLLAMGFTNPNQRLLELFSIPPGSRGNAKANERDYQTCTPGVFAAGDLRRGQSLVVGD